MGKVNIWPQDVNLKKKSIPVLNIDFINLIENVMKYFKSLRGNYISKNQFFSSTQVSVKILERQNPFLYKKKTKVLLLAYRVKFFIVAMSSKRT